MCLRKGMDTEGQHERIEIALLSKRTQLENKDGCQLYMITPFSYNSERKRKWKVIFLLEK